ncbi:MAG: hypothetical protein PHT33_13895 [bacterium]|nr:hypothetical protein [bacterium]
MEEISRLRKEVSELEKKRREVINRIMNIKPYVAGSLLKREVRCGKAGCRCEKGELHGPFWYLSQRIEGKTRYTYIPRGRAGVAREKVSEHQRLQELKRKLRQLGKEEENLLEEIARVQEESWRKEEARDDERV